MKEQKVTIGLYRHFKGAYYFVQNVVKDAVRDIPMCYYYNVMHPEYGFFVRPIDEWFDEETNQGKIVDRPDNYTGQTHRFEKVLSLDWQVKNTSTEHLMRELAQREDSPLQVLDIEGLSEKVFCSDYVVGEKFLATDEYPSGVVTIASFADEEKAKTYFATHKLRKNSMVFKRTFIEVE